jgi:hypothetical protein
MDGSGGATAEGHAGCGKLMERDCEDVSDENRGERQEALVQGMSSSSLAFAMFIAFCRVSESRLMCRCLQDMHYAEFGEDEVRTAGAGAMAKSSFCRLPNALLCALVRADIKLQECCPSCGYQGIRRQQVEGDWTKSRKTGKGRRSVPFLHTLNTRENAIVRFHHSVVDWNRPNQNFTGL